MLLFLCSDSVQNRAPTGNWRAYLTAADINFSYVEQFRIKLFKASGKLYNVCTLKIRWTCYWLSNIYFCERKISRSIFRQNLPDKLRNVTVKSLSIRLMLLSRFELRVHWERTRGNIALWHVVDIMRCDIGWMYRVSYKQALWVRHSNETVWGIWWNVGEYKGKDVVEEMSENIKGKT